MAVLVALGALALAVDFAALGAGVAFAFAFTAGAFFPAALGDADLGFVVFFDLELAMGLNFKSQCGLTNRQNR